MLFLSGNTTQHKCSKGTGVQKNMDRAKHTNASNTQDHLHTDESNTHLLFLTDRNRPIQNDEKIIQNFRNECQHGIVYMQGGLGT